MQIPPINRGRTPACSGGRSSFEVGRTDIPPPTAEAPVSRQPPAEPSTDADAAGLHQRQPDRLLPRWRQDCGLSDERRRPITPLTGRWSMPRQAKRSPAGRRSPVSWTRASRRFRQPDRLLVVSRTPGTYIAQGRQCQQRSVPDRQRHLQPACQRLAALLLPQPQRHRTRRRIRRRMGASCRAY